MCGIVDLVELPLRAANQQGTPMKNHNAKDTKWKLPVDLNSVKPKDYDSSIDSANGSAKRRSVASANEFNGA